MRCKTSARNLLPRGIYLPGDIFKRLSYISELTAKCHFLRTFRIGGTAYTALPWSRVSSTFANQTRHSTLGYCPSSIPSPLPGGKTWFGQKRHPVYNRLASIVSFYQDGECCRILTSFSTTQCRLVPKLPPSLPHPLMLRKPTSFLFPSSLPTPAASCSKPRSDYFWKNKLKLFV